MVHIFIQVFSQFVVLSNDSIKVANSQFVNFHEAFQKSHDSFLSKNSSLLGTTPNSQLFSIPLSWFVVTVAWIVSLKINFLVSNQIKSSQSNSVTLMTQITGIGLVILVIKMTNTNQLCKIDIAQCFAVMSTHIHKSPSEPDQSTLWIQSINVPLLPLHCMPRVYHF